MPLAGGEALDLIAPRTASPLRSRTIVQREERAVRHGGAGSAVASIPTMLLRLTLLRLAAGASRGTPRPVLDPPRSLRGPVLARTHAAALVGIETHLVEVQVDVGLGMPQTSVVGLPEAAVRESKDRVRAAIRNAGYDYPLGRITVNLAPASMRKDGAAYDLAIAVAILAAAGAIDPARLDDSVLAGELALDGRLAPLRGALALAVGIRRAGPRALILPAANAVEAALAQGATVFGARTLAEAITHVTGACPLPPTLADPAALLVNGQTWEVDYADVRGNEIARRAMEIAAGGGHNVLLVGPPGSGKTMLARRLPTILPPLRPVEALDTTAVHSVAGLLGALPLVATPPFRAPHHTVSRAGLVGGGTHPRPGETALAHNGVLFLDELPEFSRDALEALRQPLEEAAVTITRANAAARFPTSFILVAAMNPCPCGHYGNPQRTCTCVLPHIARYRARISGPLLDRIDLHVEVPAVPYERLAARAPGEPSAAMRARVAAAREIQASRFADRAWKANARMSAADIRRHAVLDAEGQRLLGAATVRLGLSARGYGRVLKVARTIADLAGSDTIDCAHVAEAIQYRSLDRALA